MKSRDFGKEGFRLSSALYGYERWLEEQGYTQQTRRVYNLVLRHFFTYAAKRELAWEDIFTNETLEEFVKDQKRAFASAAVKGISKFLFQQKEIARPIQKKAHKLTDTYEQHLSSYDTRLGSQKPSAYPRRVLRAFHEALVHQGTKLSKLTCEDVDRFLAGYNKRYAAETQARNRGYLRAFLAYLYLENIISRNLAPLVVGAMQFAMAKPPKFLRPHEVKRLFACLGYHTPMQLRKAAMVHLAYTLGLRTKEIAELRLDDISFTRAEITLRARKCYNPITLPVPIETIKAIGAYIVGGRPKSQRRQLFLADRAPHGSIRGQVASQDIKTCMHAADLQASASWLRHTYAQNLLECGTTLFEIKEMLGHDNLQTTMRYLHVHIKLMREVLFDEDF